MSQEIQQMQIKYQEQQKEHAREIVQLKTNMFNSIIESDDNNQSMKKINFQNENQSEDYSNNMDI